VAAPSASSTPSTPPAAAPSRPDAIAPLTGLPAASKALARRPVLAVKIDNAVAARPHVGIDRADVVYELPVEGGVTRFIAMFQSRDARAVGPIRSSRLSDIDLLAEFGRPLLAFSGAAGYVLDALAGADLVLLPHGSNGSIYWREGGRFAPHNLMSATHALYRAGAGRGATRAPRPFMFGALPRPTFYRTWPPEPPKRSLPGRSGAFARIPFSSESWTAVWAYDGGSGRYRRSHGAIAHRTAAGKRISARNVIVMSIDSRVGGPTDKAGNTTPQLRFVGAGSAVLLRDGRRFEGRWARASLTQPTRFTDHRGRPFVLAPGNTWIEVVPTSVRPSFR